MTYPKVGFLPDHSLPDETTDPAAGGTAPAGVVASPKFPQIEALLQ